ncbi:restriction endonuclease [Caulobacter sp. Root1455]|uniref:Eco29kI family restriction endonuclease n=1 Tax=Caulobacter sp. Root1455 TaxID=1736465 RepID=UPI0006F7CFB2|nr:Eco29kI family restriction endonuclease [Caulobacter sp. Root1455]KQY95443.1 restriction endonuclease [Caulobacter sp. Root1455]
MNKPVSLDVEIAALRARVASLTELAASAPFAPTARRKVDSELRDLIETLEAALRRLDPIAMPRSVFDPSNPKVIGRFTALAMVAQERVPLADIGQFYGSGVYAIYYRGAYPLYAPLSGSETPIYVGQAAPGEQGAHTARDQGPRLAARLNEHRKNIIKADTTLEIADFDARFLVVQSGWETAAEDYLIHLFRPIWNSETNLLYGLGKHGDSATTRANKRSPWDTLHPGRAWAAKSTEDARTPEQIVADVTAHFRRHQPYVERGVLLETFFAELRQS